MQYSSWVPDVNKSRCQANRFVYIKQNSVYGCDQKATSKTILINPNFKTNVHINPNFTGARNKPSIYINPNVFKGSHSGIYNKDSNASVTSQWSTDNHKNLQTISTDHKPIIATRTKIVRVQHNEKRLPPHTSQENKKIVVRSRYKFVKSDVVKPLCETSNSHRLNSKFKIDNRTAESRRRNKKLIIQKTKSAVYISPIKSNIPYVKIGNATYKKSRLKLQRSNSFEKKKTPKRKVHKIINKNGVKYEINVNRRTLKRLSESAIKQASPEKIKRLKVVLFAKKNFIKSRCLSRISKRNNFHPSPSKLKKCNVPCMFYRKFGRCRAKERGRCNKIHDPAQIIICPRFLQGACVNKTCLLSHNVSPEKMPTCKYYLEGLCSKEDCQYLHVKVNPKADICQDFLKGYCEKGKECNKRHQYLCPDYEKNGKCLKKKCRYPHGNLVRRSFKKKELSVKQPATKKDNTAKNDCCKTRYYKELVNGESKDAEIELKREKLGELPCFIPLADHGGC